MRFILVQVRDERFGPEFGVKWRATCATENSKIDVWFFAYDLPAAKARIREEYPLATFSDEPLH